MKGKSLTLTIIANMTSNYGEGLGNGASVQKVFRGGKTYAIRSRESIKNAIMGQSGMHSDLETNVDEKKDKKVSQKVANKEKNATNCRALEGGYMNTSEVTNIRKSSFYLTDAISCNEYVIESRFHNNLYLATNFAKANNISVQDGKAGLMPYQYEYDKGKKVYSITIDLDMIGTDENFDSEEASKEEKVDRVLSIINAVENLSLVVKGNLDNAEPLFVVGGLVNRKTHYFENVVNVKDSKVVITEDLKERVLNGCSAGLLQGGNFDNEISIKEELNAKTVNTFFRDLEVQVREYYGVE